MESFGQITMDDNKFFTYYMFKKWVGSTMFYSHPFTEWEYLYIFLDAQKELLKKQEIEIVKFTSEDKLPTEGVRFVLELFVESSEHLFSYLKTRNSTENEESLF